MKLTHANHYYDRPERGVERRAALVRPQYQDHARCNDEHYYGVDGATPFQNTLRCTEVMPVVFGRHGDWSASARKFVDVATAAGATKVHA